MVKLVNYLSVNRMGSIKIKKACFFLFFLVLYACQTGNGTDHEIKISDSLTNEVIKGRLKLIDLANSNQFMYFDSKYFSQPADLTKIPQKDQVQIKVVTYRIFKNVKLVNNRYVFTAPSAKSLHIPNQIYVNYQRSFEQMNRQAASSKDSIQLPLPVDYFKQILEDE